MKSNGIPFWLIVIINMNVMIGVGVFINPVPLVTLAGSLSGFSYLLTGIIIAPLVFVIAELARINPAVEGGLFSYSREAIGPKAGIVSALSYFLAKTISEGIILRVAVLQYFKTIFPILSQVSDFILVLVIVVIFGFLNSLGMKFGSKLQLLFVIFKMIPILSVLIFVRYIFNPSYFSYSYLPTIKNFAFSTPIALYAMMGFETCCSIGHTVRGGSKYLYRSIITSFILVVVLLSTFQFSLYAGVGLNLLSSVTPLGLFFEMASNKVVLLEMVGKSVLNSFILTSMLGAFYGMMQANNWNMFVVAREIKWLSPLTKINKYGMPLWCILLQSVISLCVALSMFRIPDIQRLVVLGIVICYFLSVVALFKFYSIKGKVVSLSKFITSLSLISCIFIAYQCVKGLF